MKLELILPVYSPFSLKIRCSLRGTATPVYKLPYSIYFNPGFATVRFEMGLSFAIAVNPLFCCNGKFLRITFWCIDLAVASCRARKINGFADLVNNGTTMLAGTRAWKDALRRNRSCVRCIVRRAERVNVNQDFAVMQAGFAYHNHLVEFDQARPH